MLQLLDGTPLAEASADTLSSSAAEKAGDVAAGDAAVGEGGEGGMGP